MTSQKRDRSRAFISIESDDVADRGASPSREFRREERFARFESAMAALSPEHREVLVLARIEGLNLTEVGERMGRSPNATAKLVGRALDELKKKFGDRPDWFGYKMMKE